MSPIVYGLKIILKMLKNQQEVAKNESYEFMLFLGAVLLNIVNYSLWFQNVILTPHFIQMENETELEKARRRLDDAEAGMKNATEFLNEYHTSNPGAIDAGQLAYATSLNNIVAQTNRVVSEATSRLNALESNRNQRFPGICTLQDGNLSLGNLFNYCCHVLWQPSSSGPLKPRLHGEPYKQASRDWRVISPLYTNSPTGSEVEPVLLRKRKPKHNNQPQINT